MAIKYLRGLYGKDQVKTTRPEGFEFPLGITVSSPTIPLANSANTSTTETFDVLVVAGGGSTNFQPPGTGSYTGGGGAGGIRVLSQNNFSEITEFKNPLFISGSTNFIPVIVGGADANSCFGSNFTTCRGGRGAYWAGGSGGPGGSGGGAAGHSTPAQGSAGLGIVGQGCNGGGPGTAPGGSALANASTTCGLTSSITGTAIKYSNGGCGGAAQPVRTANRGDGGSGSGRCGASGIVAIRYRNPTAPTTPIATGGDCICCTGGCIIHIFNSSGFFNVNTSFSIN